MLLAYAPYLAPRAVVGLPGLMVFWSFFCTTVIILCDESAAILGGPSLLGEITGSRRAFFEFVAVGAVSGLLLDGAAQWIGKLWIYPYWTQSLYAVTFVLGFCAYWLLMAETYLLGCLLLRRAVRPRPRRPPAWASLAFTAGAVAGAALAAWGLALAVAGYRAAGGFRFDIATPSRAAVPFLCFPLIFTGVWLLLEFVQHRRGRVSLAGALFRGDWVPLAAMLAAAWVFGFFMETVNAAHHFWRYTNWPFGRVRVAGVPAVVLLLWPLQYVVFLAVYEAISRKSLFEA